MWGISQFVLKISSASDITLPVSEYRWCLILDFNRQSWENVIADLYQTWCVTSYNTGL